LTLLRDQLAQGQDASILYSEVGRVIRTTLHLAVDPELEPTLSDSHRSMLQPFAEEVGSDGLARMLGLWLDHGHVMRDAANRELALEVVAMRLARWPSVRAVEDWLRGAEGQLPVGPGPGDSPPPAPPAPAAPGGATPAAGSGGSASAPETSGDGEGCEIQGDLETGGESLEEEARSDPGVVMAQKILGGDVVRVRPDHTALNRDG
jgi:hypothetical protein